MFSTFCIEHVAAQDEKEDDDEIYSSCLRFYSVDAKKSLKIMSLRTISRKFALTVMLPKISWNKLQDYCTVVQLNTNYHIQCLLSNTIKREYFTHFPDFIFGIGYHMNACSSFRITIFCQDAIAHYFSQLFIKRRELAARKSANTQSLYIILRNYNVFNP